MIKGMELVFRKHQKQIFFMILEKTEKIVSRNGN